VTFRYEVGVSHGGMLVKVGDDNNQPAVTYYVQAHSMLGNIELLTLFTKISY